MAACTDVFVNLDRRVFTHDHMVTAREWTEELETHSPIVMLDDGAT
jgi:hypothetical protein